ncbi:MAG: amidase, partial [Acidobacteriaceae bacterium]
MARSRREFLAKGSMGLVGAAVAVRMAKGEQTPVAGGPQVPGTPGPGKAGAQVPGEPGAFGTSAATGPEVSVETFVQAEKLVRVEMSAKDMKEAAGNWRESMAAVVERRVGPRKLAIGYGDVPATVWNPLMPKTEGGAAEVAAPRPRDSRGGFVSILVSNGPPSGSDEGIAFASVWQLSRWLEAKQLKSERLTKIYLERLERFNKELNCVITLTADHALEQARKADAEIAAGKYRGPLHGIPWGAKDLLDTAGIRTTWGAAPFKDRVPVEDATVTKRLNEAGAVLVAKLSLGALALNDVWFGGQTKNPWNLDEGASGSSAGPAGAVAAGLVGFALGSETQGSIVSPSMRCGVTGLRPTFGRVPRTGAMTLSWSCDK